MSKAAYAAVYRWFRAHPAACGLLKLCYRGLPIYSAAAYGVLLARLGYEWYAAAFLEPMPWLPAATAAETAMALCRAVCVPAVTFLGGTLLRRFLNVPRPYEMEGFVPLIEKETAGNAFPSRHALSAAVIAAAWWPVLPAMGAVQLAVAILIAATRVLAGVHSVQDVIAGLALGLACGGLGMLVF